MHGQQAPISDDILDPEGSGFAEHLALPGSDGARYYIIQRVNGNGANGKEGISTGGHKHSLEDSDKVKKNSIARFYLKEEKERKKSQVRKISFIAARSWSPWCIRPSSSTTSPIPTCAPTQHPFSQATPAPLIV